MQAARPILCPVIVGRDASMAILEHALDRGASDQGQAIVLTGEAGVGKSRLAAETRARAAARRYAIFAGQCFEEDRALPYAPFLELLRTQLALWPTEERARALGPATPVLASLLPELDSIPPDSAHLQALDPVQAQHRLFQALAGFFIDRAATHPVLLVVEDLHWSDESTRAFVLYLARRIAHHQIVLLLTCRGDEPQLDLDRFLATLERERLVTELALPPLGQTDIAAMLRAIFNLDRPPRADFLDAIATLTEGNPFFIEEVLKSLVASGDIFQTPGGWDRKALDALRIPRTVGEAVRRRIAHVSRAARETLRLAAALGRRFDFELLQELTGYDERDLLVHISDLVNAQLIVEESAERFAFRHALTRQAVYGQLLARERRALHQQIAQALERHAAATPTLPLADLAHHFREAGAWAQTLDYARRAGEQALAAQAGRVAAELFTHALQAAEALGVTPPLGLYRARGVAYEMIGEFALARQDQETALVTARRDSDAYAEWQALLDLGFLWSGRDLSRAGEYFQQALARARELHDSELIAQSLNRLGNWYFNRDLPLDAQRCHTDALAIFETLDNRQGLADTLDLLGLVTSHLGLASESQQYFERAIGAFAELDDQRGLASALAMSAQMRFGAAEDATLPTARAERAAQLAHTIGWPAGEAFALASLAFCRLFRGQYREALGAARSALAIAEAIEHEIWMLQAHVVLGLLYGTLLALPLALEHMEWAAALAREAGSRYWQHVTAALLAQIELGLGDARRATSILDAAFGATPPGTSLPQQMCLALRTDLVLAQDDPARALTMLTPLLEPNTPAPGADLQYQVWRIQAEALIALGQNAEAEAILLAACDAAFHEEARAWQWRLQLALGRCYALQGRAGDAEHAFAEARALVDALAENVPDEPLPAPPGISLRTHFLQAATIMLPLPRPLTSRQAAKQAFGGLTARERDVALLIAQGKSNREIAETLVIGSRTVQTHVANIFAKLGCGSRAQVAAWVAARGELPDTSD
jgi:DNA-binding CsgD family transcriptional regulator